MSIAEFGRGDALVTDRSLFPPAAYIIGAPKCGTTALAQYLSEHPAISISRPKEPHYYSKDLGGLRRCSDDEEYRACFTPTPQTRMLMEASVWYLYSQTAIASILEARPDARFIVMLRDPVRMLASLHRQLLRALDEDEPDFERAWNLSAERARGERVPPGCRAPSTLVYTRTAAFGEQLERLFSLVPRDRCLVLFQEEMQADTAKTYRRALDFLGLEDDGRSEFPRINEARRSRSRSLHYLIARGRPFREAFSRPVKRMLGRNSLGVMKKVDAWNTAKLGSIDISPDLARTITEHYAEDNRKLKELLRTGVHYADDPASPIRAGQTI